MRHKLTVQRFDLDPDPPEPNTVRDTGAGANLPVEFPILLHYPTGEIVEPVFLFTLGKYQEKQGQKNWKASADARIDDLKGWWETMLELGIKWDDPDPDFVIGYGRALRTSISKKTKKEREPTTILRRKATVSQFYEFVNRYYGLNVVINWGGVIAAAGGLDGGKANRQFVRGGRTNADEHVDPLRLEDLNKVMDLLGPLPNASDHESWSSVLGQWSLPSSAGRLAAELSYWTGTRIDETCGIHASEILEIDCEGRRADEVHFFELTRTKFLDKRKIHIPFGVIRDLQTYIRGERAACVREARRLWLSENPEPPHLFLNPPGSARHVGKSLRTKTLDAWFHAAVIKAKLIRKGQAAHTFHDLRHTFAVDQFRALEAQGLVDPWQEVSRRLGHANSGITESIYLRSVRAAPDDAVEAAINYRREARRRREIQ